MVCWCDAVCESKYLNNFFSIRLIIAKMRRFLFVTKIWKIQLYSIDTAHFMHLTWNLWLSNWYDVRMRIIWSEQIILWVNLNCEEKQIINCRIYASIFSAKRKKKMRIVIELLHKLNWFACLLITWVVVRRIIQETKKTSSKKRRHVRTNKQTTEQQNWWYRMSVCVCVTWYNLPIIQLQRAVTSSVISLSLSSIPLEYFVATIEKHTQNKFVTIGNRMISIRLLDDK